MYSITEMEDGVNPSLVIPENPDIGIQGLIMGGQSYS